MRIIFDAYDEDRSGEIDEIEMRKMLISTLAIESKAHPLPQIDPFPSPPIVAPVAPLSPPSHASRVASARSDGPMRAYPSCGLFLFSRAHASAARQSEREATIAHTIALALTEMDTDGSRTITFQVRPRARRRPATHALC